MAAAAAIAATCDVWWGVAPGFASSGVPRGASQPLLLLLRALGLGRQKGNLFLVLRQRALRARPRVSLSGALATRGKDEGGRVRAAQRPMRRGHRRPPARDAQLRAQSLERATLARPRNELRAQFLHALRLVVQLLRQRITFLAHLGNLDTRVLLQTRVCCPRHLRLALRVRRLPPQHFDAWRCHGLAALGDHFDAAPELGVLALQPRDDALQLLRSDRPSGESGSG